MKEEVERRLIMFKMGNKFRNKLRGIREFLVRKVTLGRRPEEDEFPQIISVDFLEESALYLNNGLPWEEMPRDE